MVLSITFFPLLSLMILLLIGYTVADQTVLSRDKKNKLTLSSDNTYFLHCVLQKCFSQCETNWPRKVA